VRTALPSFKESMGSSLRTSEQGADTIIWAAISDEVLEKESGSFLFDREAVEQHLPGWGRCEGTCAKA
jgi:dehydrogenase/reductase SDR family protein 12